MNIIAINGSPRVNQNTATLLKKAVEGAASKGAEVELVNLYQLNYKGCTGCFSCKRKGGKNPHQCAMRDDLTPVLEKIKNADAIIFASPIYLYDVTGEMHSFLERLIFQYLPYDTSVTEGTYFPRAVKTAFLYTMGVPEGFVGERFKLMEDFITQIFRTPVRTLYVCSAYPFADDWTNYESSDLTGQRKLWDESFPKSCEAAFQLGVELTGEN